MSHMKHPPRRTAKKGFLSRWLGDQTGSVTTVFAISMPVLIGGFALSAETGYWVSEQRRMQNITDSVAAAVWLDAAQRGYDCFALRDDAAAWDSANATAWRIVGASGLGPDQMSLALTCAASDQIAIDVERDLPTFFVGLLSGMMSNTGGTAPALTISPGAAATVQLASNALPNGSGPGGGGAEIVCIHALARSGTGIEIAGTGGIVAPDCRVQADSRDSRDAILINGNSDYDVACSTTLGMHRVNGGSGNIDLGRAGTDCASFRNNTETEPLAPNLANLTQLTESEIRAISRDNHSSNERNITPTSGQTLRGMPVRRFTDDVELKSGNYTFAPGLYIFDGDDFEIGSNATVDVPDGVGFLLVNGAEIDFHQNATITFGNGLSSGPWEGLAVFSMRLDDDDDDDLYEAELTAQRLNGIVYLPGYELEMTGGRRELEGCYALISERIEINGNAAFNLTCDGDGRERICNNLGYANCGDGPGNDDTAGIIFIR
jgi:Flp pilus assembly protein TadG